MKILLVYLPGSDLVPTLKTLGRAGRSVASVACSFRPMYPEANHMHMDTDDFVNDNYHIYRETAARVMGMSNRIWLMSDAVFLPPGMALAMPREMVEDTVRILIEHPEEMLKTRLITHVPKKLISIALDKERSYLCDFEKHHKFDFFVR
jgi:hypothetical protein